MPSFTSNPFSNFFKRILQVNQATNTGVDATLRNIQDGEGNNTSISLSDDSLFVKPQNDNSTRTLAVQNAGGSIILAVDTTNSKVMVGADQMAANTQFKEMGLYDFSPSAGYHYPLISHNMFHGTTAATSFAADSDWGNGTDPATTLDVSGLSQQENAIAVYWYLQNNITLDEVRYMATADGSATLNFHLFAYDLDAATNHGDLLNGVVHANASVSATATTVKTGTFTLDTADINVNKVVIGFVENVTDTSDVSVAFTIKYHIR